MMTVSLFVTMENGILIQDSFPFHNSHTRLIGIQVPYYYFMKKVWNSLLGTFSSINVNINNHTGMTK